jgi:hypothetical protein
MARKCSAGRQAEHGRMKDRRRSSCRGRRTGGERKGSPSLGRSHRGARAGNQRSSHLNAIPRAYGRDMRWAVVRRRFEASPRGCQAGCDRELTKRRIQKVVFCGAPGPIRTADHRIRSPTLYPAELRARVARNILQPRENPKYRPTDRRSAFSGARIARRVNPSLRDEPRTSRRATRRGPRSRPPNSRASTPVARRDRAECIDRVPARCPGACSPSRRRHS